MKTFLLSLAFALVFLAYQPQYFTQFIASLLTTTMSTAIVPTTQLALFIQTPKGAWVVKEHVVPTPESGEVLTRVEAAGLNPVDWKVHDYDFGVSGYPAVVGTDIAGVVVAIGAGVQNVQVGDRVLYQGLRTLRRAAFQHYSVSPAAIVAKIPSQLSFDQAATIPVAAATAAVGLYSPNAAQSATLTAPWAEGGLGKYAGQPILILGGSSAVGQAGKPPNITKTYTQLITLSAPPVIQFAKLSGFSPIITTVSPSNFALTTSLGATHPLDRNAPLTAASLAAVTSKPITLIFDAVSSSETQSTAYGLLGEGGVLAIVLAAAIPEKDRVDGKRIVNPRGSAPDQGTFGEELYKHLGAYLEKGELKPNKVQYVPGGLASIPDALDRLRKGLVSGSKLVVRPSETTTA
ncbi:hypothetical protein EUX98_g3514 [Antrodiella citrinella]|uniref:Enoyl reductase (ER) domain-containing protein n=1 Tax=Antrodiella citrinella TaxID=2447956 RepID=A0A4S4MZ25_9APHY|nr:hypothetical protein EUX98_g3514 [Antrodiella citrinella]